MIFDDGTQPVNSIIIPKNTPLPCQNTQVFFTADPTSGAASRIRIHVLEGEANDPQACISVGTCMIEDLPPGLPADFPVEITFAYGEDGRLNVHAAAKMINRSANAEILRPQALTEQEMGTQHQLLKGLRIM